MSESASDPSTTTSQSTISTRRLSGGILAGGKSSRMGTHKALLPLHEQTFVDHVAHTLQQRCDDVVVVLADPNQFSAGPWHVVCDVWKDCGPLGGIHAALLNARHERVLIASCDTPLVPVELYDLLLENMNSQFAVVPSIQDQLHPLCGVYDKRCASFIDAFLRSGKRAVREFLAAIGAEIVAIDGTGLTLNNINTPEEYGELCNE